MNFTIKSAGSFLPVFPATFSPIDVDAPPAPPLTNFSNWPTPAHTLPLIARLQKSVTAEKHIGSNTNSWQCAKRGNSTAANRFEGQTHDDDTVSSPSLPVAPITRSEFQSIIQRIKSDYQSFNREFLVFRSRLSKKTITAQTLGVEYASLLSRLNQFLDLWVIYAETFRQHGEAAVQDMMKIPHPETEFERQEREALEAMDPGLKNATRLTEDWAERFLLEQNLTNTIRLLAGLVSQPDIVVNQIPTELIQSIDKKLRTIKAPLNVFAHTFEIRETLVKTTLLKRGAEILDEDETQEYVREFLHDARHNLVEYAEIPSFKDKSLQSRFDFWNGFTNSLYTAVEKLVQTPSSVQAPYWDLIGLWFESHRDFLMKDHIDLIQKLGSGHDEDFEDNDIQDWLGCVQLLKQHLPPTLGNYFPTLNYKSSLPLANGTSDETDFD